MRLFFFVERVEDSNFLAEFDLSFYQCPAL
jgi:hypothetical protein